MKCLSWGAAIVPVLLLTVAILNYNGLCYRTGHFITDDEMIEAAVKNALVTHNRDWTPIKNTKPVPIESVEEFMRLNDNCCGVGFLTKKHAEPPTPVTFTERITGFKQNYVYINAMRRLVHDEGRQELVDFFGAVYVSNCGRVL